MTTKNYPAGRSLPAGGSVGTVLTKASTDDQDAAWSATLSTAAANVPAVAADVTLPDLALSYNDLLLKLKAAGLMVAD